jgi:proteasome lid subunit RPN8/RPN11
MQLMDEQPGSRRLDKLIRGLANGDINHRVWIESAEASSTALITLHSLAGLEQLRQPSQSYDRFLRAVAQEATSAVVAHNHPSGALTPSHSDVAVTQKLSKALMLLDISLLDHLIAAEGRCVSLRNLGFV